MPEIASAKNDSLPSSEPKNTIIITDDAPLNAADDDTFLNADPLNVDVDAPKAASVKMGDFINTSQYKSIVADMIAKEGQSSKSPAKQIATPAAKKTKQVVSRIGKPGASVKKLNLQPVVAAVARDVPKNISTVMALFGGHGNTSVELFNSVPDNVKPKAMRCLELVDEGAAFDLVKELLSGLTGLKVNTQWGLQAICTLSGMDFLVLEKLRVRNNYEQMLYDCTKMPDVAQAWIKSFKDMIIDTMMPEILESD